LRQRVDSAPTVRAATVVSTSPTGGADEEGDSPMTTDQIENTTTTHSQPPTEVFHNGARSRFNAWFFRAFDRYINHIAARHKSRAFSGIAPGRIVEIGAGVGANFAHLPAGSTVVAVEPNLAMHEALCRRAEERGIDLELVGAGAERLPLPDQSADEVICSLVLCTVSDPAAAVAEVRRILRPGGHFRFVEHVAAGAWSPRRWLQHGIRRPWSWIFEGCDLCRDTATLVERSGFASVELDRGRLRRSFFIPVNSVVAGVATR
jgi:SAM-dependent methyltransferase